ncbi:MAG: adenylate/guanylate cyclase domain-containing protein [Burkholderiaceae bacterium]
MITPPDRDPAPSLSPQTGYSTQFHVDPLPRLSFWQRALQRFQSWHPTLRVTLVATLLWLVGAWHVIVSPIAALTRLELALDDVRQSTALSPVAAPRDDIVIIDIDDASLRALGRWPWPRDRLATLVETLFDDDHVAALGIDLVLAEPDDQARSVRDALSALTQLAPEDAALRTGVARWQGTLEARADHDARLAKALAGHPVTLAYHFNHQADPAAPGSAVVVASMPATLAARELPPPVTEPDVLPASALGMAPWQGVEVPVPVLLRAASGTGFINALPDADGELRSTLLVTGYGGAVYESFALSLWRQWHHVGALRPVIRRGEAGGPPRLTGLQLTSSDGEPLRALRVDPRGAVTLPYRAVRHPGTSPGTGRFRYIPAADVLAHRVGPRELEGRVVLLGSSAPGLADLRATPVHRALPGIEVHAQLMAGLEDNDLSVRPDWSPGFELLLLAGVLATVTLVVRRLAGPVAMLALGLILAVLLLCDLWALTGRGWAIPIAAPLAAGLLLGVLGVVANYLREWHSRRSLAQLFGHYLPPERVRAMASDPDRFLDLASSAENRELTVLFCDLRGFTPMSEKMSPERLRELLNLYFLRMSQIIHGYDGTLDKFIGDAVMAFWGAPQPDEQHAAHAVQAAMAMIAAVEPLNAELAERGLPPLAPCIGLATGVVCVGDLGSALRRSYTAVGDGVNLAARIEGATRTYDVPLLVADTTRAAAGELPGCEWVEVDEVAVKGRSQLVTLYVPLHVTDVALSSSGHKSEQEITPFHEQLGLWRLARDALRGHHGTSLRGVATPFARAVAHARLTELLAARPASPQLHALAAHRLASLAAEEAREQ